MSNKKNLILDLVIFLVFLAVDFLLKFVTKRLQPAAVAV